MSEIDPAPGAPAEAAGGLKPAGTLLDTKTSGQRPVSAWVSESLSDDSWDAFLQNTPLGHFQQSSVWASVKADEGWAPVRVVLWQSDAIVGGFQILVRSRGWFREGFLNKGPVYPGDDPEIMQWVVGLVQRSARIHRITLLLIQVPDLDRTLASIQHSRGFAPNVLAQIVTATLCVPLGPPLPPAESRMRRSIQLDARQSAKRGLTVREGNAEDIPCFFRLMGITCRRQNSQPNPASEQATLKLWQSFHQKGLGRLTIAEFDGKATAGLFAVQFGRRVTAWKKGWDEENRDKHPNTLLSFESIKWAEAHQATLYDFGAFDRTFARQLLAGEPVDQRLRSSRYFYLMGFAAEPQLQALAQVWIGNPLARAAYRAYAAVRGAANKSEA